MSWNFQSSRFKTSLVLLAAVTALSIQSSVGAVVISSIENDAVVRYLENTVGKDGETEGASLMYAFARHTDSILQEYTAGTDPAVLYRRQTQLVDCISQKLGPRAFKLITTVEALLIGDSEKKLQSYSAFSEAVAQDQDPSLDVKSWSSCEDELLY